MQLIITNNFKITSYKLQVYTTVYLLYLLQNRGYCLCFCNNVMEIPSVTYTVQSVELVLVKCIFNGLFLGHQIHTCGRAYSLGYDMFTLKAILLCFPLAFP